MSAALRLAVPCALALACASPPPAAPEPARVSVEVLRGFTPEESALSLTPAPVALLLDATSSMQKPTGVRVSHHVAAQRAAARFANGLPEAQPLWLYVLGVQSGAECQPVLRGTRAETAAARRELLAELYRVAPRSEGALADALDAVRQELWNAGALSGSRVVVFSDFGGECGGDVCAAAAKLTQGGAQLDVVALGAARVPACLREPTGLAEDARPTGDLASPIRFRIEVSQPEPLVVGWGEADGLPVAAPPGAGTVVVDLDPPLRVEATFAAGGRHVLQVLDFPALDPATRHWRWLDSPPDPAEAASQP